VSSGAFLNTRYIVDPSRIYEMNVNSREFKDILVSIFQNMNSITNMMNMKTTGTFPLQEFVTGNQYFPNPSLSSASSTTPVFRAEYRKVINFGALPGSTSTASVAHEIDFNSNTLFTGVYGIASDTTSYNYIPIPYATSTAADIVEINVDTTNVNITVGKDMSAFDKVLVVLSYLKS